MNEAKIQIEYIDKIKSILSDKERLLGRKLTCHITTFGCQMNAKDSEKLLGILLNAGYVNSDSEDADLILFNTCTVRENANERLYGRLGRVHHYKKSHPDTIVGICGCMMQENDEIECIKEKYKFVDIVFGTHNIFKLAEILYECLSTKKRVFDIWEDTNFIVENLPSSRKYSFKSGVNIMYGCNNFCSYCIVPYVRGRERSRKPEDIIDEIKMLVDDGVKEVMLLGQNVNSYGKNLDNPISFAKLLSMIEKINGLCRIRFMTSHPKDLSDDLIEVMASSKKICNHLHLPLQSGSSKILKQMNRHYDKEQYLELVRKLRVAIPDISLTTDIIVGFPGETEEDFNDTIDVIEKVRFDNAFTFIYSKREGTPAAKLSQIPEDIVKDRFNRLLSKVQEISSEVCDRNLGETCNVLVEDINDHDSSLMSGRMTNNSLVHFPGTKDLIGKIVNIKILESKGFYYIGRMEE